MVKLHLTLSKDLLIPKLIFLGDAHAYVEYKLEQLVSREDGVAQEATQAQTLGAKMGAKKAIEELVRSYGNTKGGGLCFEKILGNLKINP